jgi:Fic family protein
MTHSGKKWIWEHDDYPHFPYDKAKVTEKLRKAEYLRGLLAGMLSFANQEDLDQLEITSITDEIIGTSQIEGECLRRESVKDSVANAINSEYTSEKDLSTKHTDDLTELALDSFRNDEPLSLERLHSWHTAIFANIPAYDDTDKITIGTFREYDEMRVVENLFNRKGKVVKYVAPPHRMIKKDIEALLDYCNSSDEEPYIKSALAHLWFVSIHPYDDGNGRVSRAIADYILSSDTQDEYKIYSMANAIYAKREEYYRVLDMTTNLYKNRHYDFTLWIEWNLDILIDALEKSHKNIQLIIKKTKFWDKHREVKLTKKHILFLDNFMEELSRNKKNAFSNQDYRKVTGVSPVTASRHIKRMLECGCIKMMEGKARRNASYTIVFDDEN